MSSFPFSEFIRTGVKLADDFTADVQPAIMHRAWIGQDLSGNKAWAAPTSPAPRCVIDNRQRVIVSQAGQMTTIMATLTFTTLPASNGAPGRREPIDPQDIVALPDGFTGPIVGISGTIDPKTGKGFILEVMLGAR